MRKICLTIDSGSWVGNSITMLIFGTMAPGTYNYTIRVSDSSGNWVEDTVIVTVISSGDPSPAIPEYNPVFLIVTIFVTAIVLLAKKKKNENY